MFVAMPLNDKQKRFCQEYAVDSNATQAAIRAGYSAKTAEVQGSRLLSYANVAEEIKRLQQKTTDDLGLTREMIIAELMKIGFSNITDYINKDFSIKDLIKLAKEKTAAIESITFDEETIGKKKKTKVKFKLYNKQEALDRLGKVKGIYEEDNKQKAEMFKAIMGVDIDKI